MIKISSTDAYQGLDADEIKTITRELEDIYHLDQRQGQEMTYQYFLEDAETITLKVYWNQKEVTSYRFKNKGGLTDTAKNKLQQKGK